MGMTREEIVQKVNQYAAARRAVVFAYLFGSVVEDDTFRDVDVGIYVDDSISDGFGYTFEMSCELEKLLGYNVDVILMNTAPDHMIYSISRGKLVVDRDQNARVAFITRAWSRYFDVQVKRRAYLQAVAEESGAHERS